MLICPLKWSSACTFPLNCPGGLAGVPAYHLALCHRRESDLSQAVLSYSCLITCKVLHPFIRKAAPFSFRAAMMAPSFTLPNVCCHSTGQLFLWREGAISKQMAPILILILAPLTHPSPTFPLNYPVSHRLVNLCPSRRPSL